MPSFSTLVDLIGCLTTPVKELFNAYTTMRVAKFGQPMEFLQARSLHHIDFLQEHLTYVNFIAQHPELTHNDDFKYDYQRFLTGFDEIANAANSHNRMALIQDVELRLEKVCAHLNDIDPAVDIDMTPLNESEKKETELI